MTKHLSASVLAWLRSFDAAARHNSFTRAAAELNVTQGSVSQQVKNLEEYLGVALFMRGQRHLSLTPQGKQLAGTTTHSLADLSRAVASLKIRPHTQHTTLSCSPSFAMLWLTPRIGSLIQAQPQLSVRIQGEFHMLDSFRLEEDDIKAGIRFDPGGYTDLKATEFLDEWLIPVCSPHFLAQHASVLKQGQLRSEWMLHDANPWDNAPENAEWNHWLKKTGRPVPAHHTGMHFNLSQLALTAALSGQGIAMGRLALVLEDLKKQLLVCPFAEAVKSQASYYLVSASIEGEEVNLIRQWLLDEGRRFVEQRASYL